MYMCRYAFLLARKNGDTWSTSWIVNEGKLNVYLTSGADNYCLKILELLMSYEVYIQN